MSAGEYIPELRCDGRVVYRKLVGESTNASMILFSAGWRLGAGRTGCSAVGSDQTSVGFAACPYESSVAWQAGQVVCLAPPSPSVPSPSIDQGCASIYCCPEGAMCVEAPCPVAVSHRPVPTVRHGCTHRDPFPARPQIGGAGGHDTLRPRLSRCVAEVRRAGAGASHKPTAARQDRCAVPLRRPCFRLEPPSLPPPRPAPPRPRPGAPQVQFVQVAAHQLRVLPTRPRLLLLWVDARWRRRRQQEVGRCVREDPSRVRAGPAQQRDMTHRGQRSDQKRRPPEERGSRGAAVEERRASRGRGEGLRGVGLRRDDGETQPRGETRAPRSLAGSAARRRAARRKGLGEWGGGLGPQGPTRPSRGERLEGRPRGT